MLTREKLGWEAYVAHLGLSAAQPLTPSQLRESLLGTLAQKPGLSELWVFAYGSLMWNPVLQHDRVEPATLQGWHRAFCLEMWNGRGDRRTPGRMLALEPGGTVQGLALRLSGNRQDEDLELLWNREMIVGSYRPVWTRVRLTDRARIDALTFVADTQGPQYRLNSAVSDVAGRMAMARGALGSNADYVHRLQDALRQHGLRDDYVAELDAELRRLERLPACGITGPQACGHCIPTAIPA